MDAVGGQALAQRFDDGNATGHGRFKGHHHTFGRSCRKNLGAVHCQQGLVGGHHMFARGNRLHYQRPGNAVAADEFNHDVDVRVGNDRPRVVDHRHALTDQALGPGHIEVGHHGDLNPAPGTTLDFFLIAAQHVKRARPYNTHAQQAHLNGFHK